MREAIVTLSDSELEAMGFGGLVSTFREAGIRDVELLEDRGSHCVPQVEVEERIDLDEIGTFETRLGPSSAWTGRISSPRRTNPTSTSSS